MLESKLDYSVNELLKNKDQKKSKMLLDTVGELLLKLPYFKLLMEEYPDPNLGPIMVMNLLNHINIQKFEPNSVIWEYNDKVKGVYIIITGEVKIFKPPNKIHLIRYKKIEKKENPIIEDNENTSRKTMSKKYRKATKNLLKYKEGQHRKRKARRTNLFRTSFLKMNAFKKKQNSNIKRRNSCLSLSTDLKLEINNNINMTSKIKTLVVKDYGDEISLTEKNYIYREKLNYREVDYIESFGKMIGEDCLIQHLNYHPYGAETLTKCILGFLSSQDYHILFDKINTINKSNIISFLYNVNYFNNKNNFIHRLYRGIKTRLFTKGNYIYKQNEPFKSMYIIKKGSVNINIQKIMKFETEINSDLIFEERKKNIRHINGINEIDRFTCDRVFEIKGEYFEKKIYTIVNYGQGEILGNLEYFGKIKNYLCSAQCLSNVELYEIDMNIYKKFETIENIEFLDKKTKKQLEFFKNRIKEIDKINYYTGKNKFISAFYYNNPEIQLTEKEKKYINNPKNPIPMKIRLKDKKLINTKITPYGLQEWSSFSSEEKINLDNNSNNKQTLSSSPFITNNKEYTKIFTNKNYYINKNKNNGANIFTNINKEQSLLSFNSSDKNRIDFKYNRLKSCNQNNKYQTLSFNNKEESKQSKEIEFDYNKILDSNELNFTNLLSFSSLSPINIIKSKSNKNISNLNIRKNNNNYINKKFTINLGSPSKERYFYSSSRDYTNITSPKMNVYNNLIKDGYLVKFKKSKEEEIDKKNNKIQFDKNVKQNNICNNSMRTTIAFKGYRVFLQRKEIQNKIKKDQRFKSYKIDGIKQFDRKNKVLEKENVIKKKNYINKDNVIIYKKTDNKRKTLLNKNYFMPIRLKSLI